MLKCKSMDLPTPRGVCYFVLFDTKYIQSSAILESGIPTLRSLTKISNTNQKLRNNQSLGVHRLGDTPNLIF